MSEFHVLRVFPVSFQPLPFVVGRTIGDFTVGQSVSLRKKNGLVVDGSLDALDIHQRVPDEFSFVFSEEISRQVEAGDIIYSTESSSAGQ